MSTAYALSVPPAMLSQASQDTAEILAAIPDLTMDQYDATALFVDPKQADKINTVLCYLEALGEMTGKEIARQQARQRAIEEAARRIEREVLSALESAEQTTIHGQHCTLQLRRNPPSVRIETPGLIPAEYMRTPPPPAAIPDKLAIRAAIEADIFVPGCALVRSTKLVRK